jgi:hypothetical protein
VTPQPPAAFYCMSSAAYFLGAVGMINSLRLQGHTEPIYLLDLGLTERQRELLTAEATIVPAPPGTPPWLAKTVAPLAHPAETMVLIDADIIVTRPLGELIVRAARGGVLAFENNVDRFVPEWGELLDLGELRRRPYVCSALVCLGGETGAEVLRLLDDRQRRVDFEHTFFAADDPDYPLRFLDQDVLNAVIAAVVDGERLESLDYRLATPIPFEGLRIVDERGPRCAFEDGTEPYLLHHILPTKPWLVPTPEGVYTRLLRRLLSGPDLAVRPPAEEVPLRFRQGPLALAESRRADLAARTRWHLGIALHRIRTRIGSATR